MCSCTHLYSPRSPEPGALLLQHRACDTCSARVLCGGGEQPALLTLTEDLVPESCWLMNTALCRALFSPCSLCLLLLSPFICRPFNSNSIYINKQTNKQKSKGLLIAAVPWQLIVEWLRRRHCWGGSLASPSPACPPSSLITWPRASLGHGLASPPVVKPSSACTSTKGKKTIHL